MGIGTWRGKLGVAAAAAWVASLAPRGAGAEETDVAHRVGMAAFGLRDTAVPRPEQTANAVKEVIGLGPTAVPHLVELLADPVGPVRQLALRALAVFRPPEALAALIHALHDEEAEVAIDAAAAVGGYPGDLAVRALVRFVGHPEPSVRQAVLRALETQPPVAVREVIQGLLSRPPLDVGPGPFLTALGKFPDKKTEGLLIASLDKPPVATAALEGLALMGPKAAPKLAKWIATHHKQNPALAAKAVNVLATLGEGTRDALRILVEQAPLEVKRVALHQMLEQAGQEAGAVVTRYAAHSNPEVRRVALEFMALIPGASARPSLPRNLQDKDASLRLLALQAVPAQRDPEVQRLLSGRYHELATSPTRDNQLERAELLRAIGRSGEEGIVPELINSLRLADEAGAAVEGLCALGKPAVGALLFVIKSGDPNEVPLAVRSLACMGRLALDDMVALLAHPSREVRNVTRKALADAGTPDLTPRIIQLIRNPKTPGREQLVLLLGRLYTAEGFQMLRTLIATADHPLRMAAIRALGEVPDPAVLDLLRQVAVGDDNAEIRDLVVQLLVGRGDSESVPVLTQVMARDKPHIVAKAALGVGYLGGLTNVPELVLRMSSPIPQVVGDVRDALRRIAFQPQYRADYEFEAWYKEFRERQMRLPELKGGEVALKDGVVMRYWVGGAGKPLIVLHDGPDFDHRYLRPGVDLLALDHVVVYIDLPGRGGSKAPAGYQPSLEGDVAAVANLLARLNFFDVDVWGHGWGGFVAARLAEKHPRVVKRLVLDSLPLPTRAGWIEDRVKAPAASAVEPWKSDIALFSQEVTAFRPIVRDKFLTTALFVASVRRVPVLVDVVPLLETRPRLRQAILDRMGEFDLRPTFAGITKPTLLVYGEHAPSGEESRTWRQTLAGASQGKVTLVMIEGAGYLPTLENPLRYREVLDRFLR
jgi:pimeloyl-ACP methyl ester carboxylesterase/HEAT repeat protein